MNQVVDLGKVLLIQFIYLFVCLSVTKAYSGQQLLWLVLVTNDMI